MLGDYTTLIGYATAAINGIIAVRVAQFPLESARSKHLLVGVVSLISIGAIGLGVYAQHEVVAQHSIEISHDSEVRNLLAIYIAQGDQLLAIISDPAQPYSVSQSLAWGSSVEGFLSSELGDAYVTRFRDNTGILHGEPMQIDETRQGYWNWIYERVARLEEFSSEIPAP